MNKQKKEAANLKTKHLKLLSLKSQKKKKKNEEIEPKRLYGTSKIRPIYIRVTEGEERCRDLILKNNCQKHPKFEERHGYINTRSSINSK